MPVSADGLAATKKRLRPLVAPFFMAAIVFGAFSIWMVHLNSVCSLRDASEDLGYLVEEIRDSEAQPIQTRTYSHTYTALDQFSLSDNQPVSAKENSRNPEHSHHQERQGWWERVECETNMGDWFVALFTFFLSVFTVGLWVATGRSADIAERAMIDLERAYVFFEDTKRTRAVSSPGRFFVIFKNHGKTPAIAMSRRIACEFRDSVPDPTEAPEHFFPKGAIVGSGASWIRGIVDVPDEMIQEWQNSPTGRIYLYGELRYWDIFGKVHRTWFCRRYTNRNQFVLDDMIAENLNGYD